MYFRKFSDQFLCHLIQRRSSATPGKRSESISQVARRSSSTDELRENALVTLSQTPRSGRNFASQSLKFRSGSLTVPYNDFYTTQLRDPSPVLLENFPPQSSTTSSTVPNDSMNSYNYHRTHREPTNQTAVINSKSNNSNNVADAHNRPASPYMHYISGTMDTTSKSIFNYESSENDKIVPQIGKTVQDYNYDERIRRLFEGPLEDMFQKQKLLESEAVDHFLPKEQMVHIKKQLLLLRKELAYQYKQNNTLISANQQLQRELFSAQQILCTNSELNDLYREHRLRSQSERSVHSSIGSSDNSHQHNCCDTQITNHTMSQESLRIEKILSKSHNAEPCHIEHDKSENIDEDFACNSNQEYKKGRNDASQTSLAECFNNNLQLRESAKSKNRVYMPNRHHSPSHIPTLKSRSRLRKQNPQSRRGHLYDEGKHATAKNFSGSTTSWNCNDEHSNQFQPNACTARHGQPVVHAPYSSSQTDDVESPQRSQTEFPAPNQRHDTQDNGENDHAMSIPFHEIATNSDNNKMSNTLKGKTDAHLLYNNFRVSKPSLVDNDTLILRTPYRHPKREFKIEEDDPLASPISQLSRGLDFDAMSSTNV